MFKNITLIDLKILTLYTIDYASFNSIREITLKLNINYSHAFKRIKELVKRGILIQEKNGQANNISLNIKNLEAIQLLSFVEEQESKKLMTSSLQLISREAIQIDPFVCIGVFGSRVSGKAKNGSDWDVFIITAKEEKMEKIMTKFPYVKNIHLEVFSIDEFQNSIVSREETVVKHIIRNKRIIYNPYPFYNIAHNWEMIKYAPTQ